MECRRCSDCPTSSHHWLEDPLAPDDDDFQPGDYACKHCEVRGKECPTCFGDGTVEDCEIRACPTCKGEGVLPISEQEYDQAMNDSIRAFIEE